MGKNATKVAKNLNYKFGQKLIDTAKKSATDTLKIAGKRPTQKTAAGSWDLLGNFIADKITSIFKKPASAPHSNASSN